MPDKGKSVGLSADAFFRRRDLPIQPASAPSSLLTSDPFVPLPSSSLSLPHQRPGRNPAPRILAVEISPSALRPLAFRIFTKKHNLTLKSDALCLLCTFIGRRCGSDWRDSGSGEKLLDEIARTYKRNAGAGGILVDGGETFKAVLKGLEVPGAGGGVGVGARLLGGETSVDAGGVDEGGDTLMGHEDAGTHDITPSGAAGGGVDPRKYLVVVGAFTQPKWVYNPLKKHFEKAPKPSLLPPASSKTFLFKHRYHILHQRLLRNESFLPPTFTSKRSSTTTATTTTTTHYTITPISHLLGHHSTTFLLFGLLIISPTGLLTLTDPTGSIPLDVTYATPVPPDGAYFTPGAFVVVDGQYSEDPMKFLVLTIGMPPCERRDASAEIFGHVDFFGVGVTLDANSAQTRALRRVETSLRKKMIILADVQLDVDWTFDALRAVFRCYEDDAPPLVCVLMGNFICTPFGGAISNTSSGAGGAGATQGPVLYKSYWDRLALVLSEFPSLTQHTQFIFVPGDNDPFASTFSGGRSTSLPREAVPEVFVGRVKRVLSASASTGGAEGDKDLKGGVFTTNPARVSYFSSDIVLFRDDASQRFARHAIRFPNQTSPEGSMDTDPLPTTNQNPLLLPRKLTKTLLDQAFLSPFPLATRPLLVDYAPHTLSLYPLPRMMVLADTGVEGFVVTYEGCHVVNPGRLVVEGGGGGAGGGGGGGRRKAGWIEVDLSEGRGVWRGEGI